MPMTFRTPTTLSLLKAAFRAARARAMLLLLLSLMCGAVSGLLYAPAWPVVSDLFTVMADQTLADTERSERMAAILGDGFFTVVICHVLVMAATAQLVAPWARAVAPDAPAPLGAGYGDSARRGFRLFGHMLTGAGVSLSLIIVLVGIAQFIPAAFVQLVVAILMLGSIMMVAAIVNLANAAAARDRAESFLSAWRRGRLFGGPIVSSFAFIAIMVTFLNMTIGTLIVALAPSAIELPVSMIVGGAFMFLMTALHVAAMHDVPDFHDLMPTRRV
ncbi:hypothetical protein [Pseudokordiimonas caeni]|uniref:hypothetical protein n=1 Tax=Pseudokordiimonas caeni TaxID=2997908 RepID=UPI0028119D8B|nr:hypothetical protein [Pseudokordiimonas caeni]